MANLILKPSTGGILKLQNDDGTVDALSVSTTGNLTAAGTLGVTGAVTASSTLGVTGNTTLSGTANNLGTVTAGNISNSAIVYPDGHLIQRKFSRHDPGGHNYSSSNSNWISHGDEANFKFNFTPKLSTSTIFLEYYYGVVHTSTSGGYGWYAFTKDGNRNDWGGGIAGYDDSYGHFASGHNSYPNMYHPVYGMLPYQNNSTTEFEIGLDIKWASANWYYNHNGTFNILSVSEYIGGQIVTSG